ncbi:MAG TPA: bifunctional precorrin-2 dehydrogenase/sirohydrochlorin ferrochelatase [Methanoregula sp.]|nr:bifunctional precorrin-2 dehydrogenase/sirohydrochlorin ferrochelatase [Methanoregula sp.]
MIPLFVDCSGRRVVIFGGGKVAERKARFFRGEADVTVVSRSFGDKFTDIPVERIAMDVHKALDDSLEELVGGAFLVVGALSDPEQNNRIGAICRGRGILFNNADGEAGDVTIPSVTRGKNYTLAISTRGNSPAVSRFIRERLEAEYPALDAMIGLQADVRKRLKACEPSQQERNVILRDILDDPEAWRMAGEDPAGARHYIRERYGI